MPTEANLVRDRCPLDRQSCEARDQTIQEQALEIARYEQRCLAALDYMHRVGHRYQMAMLRSILAGDGVHDLEGMNTGAAS